MPTQNVNNSQSWIFLSICLSSSLLQNDTEIDQSKEPINDRPKWLRKRQRTGDDIQLLIWHIKIGLVVGQWFYCAGMTATMMMMMMTERWKRDWLRAVVSTKCQMFMGFEQIIPLDGWNRLLLRTISTPPTHYILNNLSSRSLNFPREISYLNLILNDDSASQLSDVANVRKMKKPKCR